MRLDKKTIDSIVGEKEEYKHPCCQVGTCYECWGIMRQRETKEEIASRLAELEIDVEKVLEAFDKEHPLTHRGLCISYTRDQVKDFIRKALTSKPMKEGLL